MSDLVLYDHFRYKTRQIPVVSIPEMPEGTYEVDIVLADHANNTKVWASNFFSYDGEASQSTILLAAKNRFSLYCKDLLAHRNNKLLWDDNSVIRIPVIDIIFYDGAAYRWFAGFDAPIYNQSVYSNQ